MSLTAQKGILLVNVGTPNELTKESVQEYLNEFLGDPFVIRGPQWLREILFKKIIIPLRAGKSLLKYQQIWQPEGSPLRVEAQLASERLQSDLNQSIPENQWIVRYAFHYGAPSVESALAELKSLGVKDLLIVPLYPQWALSTRGSLDDRLRRLGVYPRGENHYGFEQVQVASVFYNHPGFIQAEADLLNQHLPPIIDDEVAVVYSFHGLPLSHIKAVVPGCRQCLKRQGECHPSLKESLLCYRYQCLETARLISEKLGLFHWDVAFQSRLGPTRWLTPSLIEVTDHLLEQGVKVMIVQCPSFVFDCLETLEEVGQELKTHFLRNGGREFILVPALNHSPEGIKALKCLILEQLGVSYETCASSSSPTPQ